MQKGIILLDYTSGATHAWLLTEYLWGGFFFFQNVDLLGVHTHPCVIRRCGQPTQSYLKATIVCEYYFLEFFATGGKIKYSNYVCMKNT